MLRFLAGMLFGAAACAVVTTDRGRKLASDAADGLEAVARREIETAAKRGRRKKEKEEKNDDV